jgi:membrane protein DedA with SNARE-associated domain
VELWKHAAELMPRLINEYDDQTIFRWLLAEEIGFPHPLPGDMAMLIGDYRAGQGKINAFWALTLLELAILVGGSILYWLGAHGGRPLLTGFVDRQEQGSFRFWEHRHTFGGSCSSTTGRPMRTGR